MTAALTDTRPGASMGSYQGFVATPVDGQASAPSLTRNRSERLRSGSACALSKAIVTRATDEEREAIVETSVLPTLGRRGCFCPKAAVRAMPARLLLLCLLFRSSWLTVEGDRHVGLAGVLHRRGGRAAVAVRVGVAGGVPNQHRESA